VAEEKKRFSVNLLVEFIDTLKIIPYTLYIISTGLSLIITLFDAFFIYPKYDFQFWITHLNPWLFLTFMGFILFFILVISISKIAKQITNETNNIIHRTKYASIISNDEAIGKIDREIDNHIAIKGIKNSKNIFFPVLRMNLKEYNVIEIIGRTEKIKVEQRMILEIVKRVHLEEIFAHDPLGIAIVTGSTKEAFTAIVVEYTSGEEAFWKDTISTMEKKQRTEDGIFLRFYTPYRIENADISSLIQIQTGLRNM